MEQRRGEDLERRRGEGRAPVGSMTWAGSNAAARLARVAVSLTLVALACAPAAYGGTRPAPGVFVSPHSPAGQEYGIPLDQARTIGGHKGLFGAGITPPAGGGPHAGQRAHEGLAIARESKADAGGATP